MNEQASLKTETTTTASPRWWWWLVAGLVLLLLIWLVLALSGSRSLKPLRDTAVPLNITINGQPLLVDFDALNDNPGDYVNLRIRVSGNYLRLEPITCAPFSGPRIQWGLVAEGLQLNAKGFEAIVLPIVPANTQMTLEGIWRRYPGPAGCGKEPTAGLWYLEVEQIVQPNPLVAGSATPATLLSITPPPFPGTATPTVAGGLPPVGGTPIPNVTIVSTVVVGTPVGAATGAGTTVPGTATATPTSTATGTLATPTSGPGTPTGAPGVPTGTATPTPAGNPGNGTTVPAPTNPALVTATPGSGYPGPPGITPPPGYP
jgi:hypothetical protein